jgi:hypothetical protein
MGNLFSVEMRINRQGVLAGTELIEKVGDRGVGSWYCRHRPLCAGALWIAQGSGALHGSAMSGHGPFVLLGGAVVFVGLALLVWAARMRNRRTYT